MGVVGWSESYRGGVGWGHAVNNLRNDSPQNQDLTQPKSILEGVQNPSFEYKKLLLLLFYYNYVIFPIISKNYYEMLLV